jgi:hypothetical protein
MATINRALLIAAMLVLPVASGADFQQLFNGRDLSGWEHVGSGGFVVENGLLRPEGGVGLLWFPGKTVGRAIVRVVYQVKSRRDNSGVFIRIPKPPVDPWMPFNKGMEIQINDAGESDYYSTGSIYTFAPIHSRPGKVGEWNTMEVTVDGPRTVVHINGVFVAEYSEGDPVPAKKHDWDPDRGPRPDSGYIGLQNHPHGPTVFFKEISIRPLESE